MTSRSPLRKQPQILLISHNFPPTVGPESYLVYLNALSLNREGMDVTVLTTSHKFKHTRQQLDETPLKDLPANIQVIRTASYDNDIKARSPRIGGHMLKAMEATFLPESYMLWLPTALPAGTRHLAKSPSVIYSRAQKHVSNVCGWRLKRRTGLPWIAHFSDIWSGNHYHSAPIQAVIRALERRIFRDADKLIFVTQKAVDAVMPGCPDSWRQKTSVIPHGYTLEIPQATGRPIGTGPLRLIHAGVFYPGMRTPETLFQAIQKINQKRSLKGRLSLTLLGGQNQAYQEMARSMGLEDLVEFKDSVPHTECQRLIQECDLPVMIDTIGYGGVFLPSKLIEYFAFQKPVMALTEPNSAVSGLLQDCGLPFADLTDSTQSAQVLEDFLHRWESGQWELPADTRGKMRGYQIDRVNQPLFQMMAELWAQVK